MKGLIIDNRIYYRSFIKFLDDETKATIANRLYMHPEFPASADPNSTVLKLLDCVSHVKLNDTTIHLMWNYDVWCNELGKDYGYCNQWFTVEITNVPVIEYKGNTTKFRMIKVEENVNTVTLNKGDFLTELPEKFECIEDEIWESYCAKQYEKFFGEDAPEQIPERDDTVF